MKRQARMSDSKPVKFFLTLQGNRGTNGKITSVAMCDATTEKPQIVEENQTVLALKINVPVTAFDPPVYELTVDSLVPEEMKAEVEMWIQSDERDSSSRHRD